MIRALIFDLDGTLVANQRANAEAYRRALQEVGTEIDHGDYARHFGLRFDAMMQQLAPGLSAEELQQVRERKRHHYREATHLIIPNQPLIDFLLAMRKTHRTGLATTASRHNVLTVLQYFGLAEAFDAMVCGEDVSQGKPDPECYIACMKALEVTPAETLVFEDSAVGVQAAEGAGAQVIRVTFNEA